MKVAMAVLSLDASHAAGESRYKRVISSHFPCKEVASLDMIVRHVPLLRSLWLLKHLHASPLLATHFQQSIANWYRK